MIDDFCAGSEREVHTPRNSASGCNVGFNFNNNNNNNFHVVFEVASSFLNLSI